MTGAPKLNHVERRQRLLAFARQHREGQTAAEETLWIRLRARRLGGYGFRRQRLIAARFIADFYCRAALVVVEVDGPYHDEPRVVQYDDYRSRTMARRRGIEVLRFTNDRVGRDLEAVCAEILAVCRSRCPDPRVWRTRGLA
jgi:very-short-patch-repair endonuclease